MINPADLPQTIPVFPLPGAVLLPRARLPLHIFEPRYLTMMEDCLKTKERLIGMIQPRGDLSTNSPKLAAVGCAGRVTSFSETEDGRLMITLTGIARFKMTDEVEGFVPYRRVQADWGPYLGDLVGEEVDTSFDRTAFLTQLARYMRARKMGTDWSSLKEAEEGLLVNTLSMLCPFAVEEKQALLEAPTLEQRRKVLETLIFYALQSGGAIDEVRQ